MKLQKYFILSLLITLLFVTVLPNLSEASSKEGTIQLNNTNSTLNVRAEPSSEARVLGLLKHGDVVEVRGEQGDWTGIVFKNGDAYVHSNYINVTEKKTPEPSQPAAPSGEPVQSDAVVYVNDSKLVSDVSTYSERTAGGDRLLVPFRAISEALNIDVTWHQSTREVHAEDGAKTIVFKMDERRTFINGTEKQLDVQPRMIVERVNGQSTHRTMIPLRFFSEQFGADVEWSNSTREARITRAEKIDDDVLSDEYENSESIGKVTANSLNVRSGPGTSHGTVGSLPKGSVVTILGMESNGWYKIIYNGNAAYVSGSFIDEILPEDEDFSGNHAVGYVNNATLNVRSGPGTSNNVVGSLALNDRVEIISTFSQGRDNAWHHILYDGNKTGYVSAGYIQLASKPSASHGPLAGKTIYLDPGHGAQDSGGIGGGMLEKDVVLDISLRAEELLREAGAKVIMTRRDDFFLSLSQRSFLANRSDADVFVSVHTNAFNGVARGTETFWHSRYESAESVKLAHALQNAVVAKMGTHYRRVDEGNYAVIRETRIPSALLEVGFKDHPEDAAKLRTSAYRQRAAEGIRDGLINYFK